MLCFGPPFQRCGLRRLLVLVRGLPETSATGRKANEGWSVERELAATAAELLDAVSRGVRGLGGDPKVRQAKPLRIPRPFEDGDGRRRLTWGQAARALMRR